MTPDHACVWATSADVYAASAAIVEATTIGATAVIAVLGGLLAYLIIPARQ